MKKLIIAICLPLFFFSCNRDGEATGSLKVSGYLFNNNIPVKNAVVDLDDLVQYTVTSNSDGYFEINNVASGTHELNFKLVSDDSSFSKSSETVEVTSDLLLENLTLPDPVVLNDPEIERSLESNSISLSWNRYESSDFREYKLYKHNSSGLDETTGELIHVATTPQDTTFSTTIAHSSETYFRVFVADDVGLLSGSNIGNATVGSYEYEPEITLGVQADYYLSAGEEQELYFQTSEAGFYNIAWFDSWFDDYDAGSIVVSAYNDDKSTYYFQNERLIQMNGSPFPIYVPSSERVNLMIKHYDDRFQGSYGIKVSRLTDDLSTTPGTPSGFTLDPGEVKMTHFEAQANKDYQITIRSNSDGGAYGDAAETHYSIFEENTTAFAVYKGNISFACCGDPKTYTVSADTDKRVYIIIDAAYWFIWNNVVITVDEL